MRYATSFFCVLTMLGSISGQQSITAQDKERARNEAINREILELIQELRKEVRELRREVDEIKSRTSTGKTDVLGALSDRSSSDRVGERAKRSADRIQQERSRRDQYRRDTDSRDGDIDRKPETRDRVRRENAAENRRLTKDVPETAMRNRERSGGPSEVRIKKIFQAYDKNKDGNVNFREWLSMKEGKITDDRTAREKVFFDRADTDSNQSISYLEFLRDRTKGVIREDDRRSAESEQGKRD